jgi:hypothetical protein
VTHIGQAKIADSIRAHVILVVMDAVDQALMIAIDALIMPRQIEWVVAHVKSSGLVRIAHITKVHVIHDVLSVLDRLRRTALIVSVILRRISLESVSVMTYGLGQTAHTSQVSAQINAVSAQVLSQMTVQVA